MVQQYSSNISLDHQLSRHKKIKQLQPVIDELYQRYAKKYHCPGFIAGLMLDGKLDYISTAGYANVEKKLNFNQDSFFRIASITKGITAMAILALRENKKLTLDDPVFQYLPEFKALNILAAEKVITIRDLLTHSSGLPEDNAWGDRQLNKSSQQLSQLLQTGINFSNQPGLVYEYSNLGYACLGLIIERVSGQSYQHYVNQHILSPLGMHDVSWKFSEINQQLRVEGYCQIDSRWVLEPQLDDGIFSAMGGMICSLNALNCYIGLLQKTWFSPNLDKQPHFLSKNVLLEMQQASRFKALNHHYRLLNDTVMTMVEGYGYGLRWLHDSLERTFIGHSGGLPGFSSNWLIAPDYGVGFVFFTNTTHVPAELINLEALTMLIDQAQLLPLMSTTSSFVQDLQPAVMQMLMHWDHTNLDNLVADNFFQDLSLVERKQSCQQLLNTLGDIQSIHPVQAENQLRGEFIIQGQHSCLKVTYALTPEAVPRIQSVDIKLVPLSS